MRRAIGSVFALVALLGLLFLSTTRPDGMVSAAGTLAQGDIIVDDSGPSCTSGRPIFRIGGGNVGVLTSGNPLQKPRGNAFDAAGDLIVADSAAGLLKVTVATTATTKIASQPMLEPRDVTVDASGNYIVADWPETVAGSPALYRVTPAGQVTLISKGTPLAQPYGIALDRNGDYIVADQQAGLLRVTPQGQMSVIRGHGADFVRATDVRVHVNGDYIVADGSGAILRVAPNGTMMTIHRGLPFSTLAPDGKAVGPRGLVIDSGGDYIMVDERSRGVYRVSPLGNVSTIIAGTPFCAPADVNVVFPASLVTPTPTPIGTLVAPIPRSPEPGTRQPRVGAGLIWSNPANTEQVQVQVMPANNDGPAINLIRNVQTSFEVTPPVIGEGPYLWLPDMTYTWRVRATAAKSSVGENDPVWGNWSEPQTFRTAPRDSSKSKAKIPADGAIAVSGTPALQWENGDKDVFYYEVQVSGDARFDPNPTTATSFVYWNLVHGGVSTPVNSWQTPPLTPGRYYWRVRPRIQGDGTPVAWSETWSFRVQ